MFLLKRHLVKHCMSDTWRNPWKIGLAAGTNRVAIWCQPDLQHGGVVAAATLHPRSAPPVPSRPMHVFWWETAALGLAPRDTAGGRGGQLVVSLLPLAIGFLFLSQVGSTVAVRMSYCGWTSSKTFPPASFLILPLCTLCVYAIQTIFIMKSAKWKSENLCFEIPQVSPSPEPSDGFDTDSHRKASCPTSFLSPKTVTW